MGISGSLQNFSLPEIFQIIENGLKTGRLSITFDLKNEDLQYDLVNYLWFKSGNFVALSKPYKHNLLLYVARKEKLICPQNFIKINTSKEVIQTPLGRHLLKERLLTIKDLDLLFKKQLETVYLLFEAERGNFIFEDIDENNLVAASKITFPLMEMVGQVCQPMTISLNAMRSLKYLNKRLMEQMPDPSSGLVRLVDNHDYKLLPIEACLWSDADKKTSLKKIAQKTLFDIQDLQKAALRLILIGLIEEVTITEYSPKITSSSFFTKEPAFSSRNPVLTQSKTKVSNSLLGNLVNFLRNNF